MAVLVGVSRQSNNIHLFKQISVQLRTVKKFSSTINDILNPSAPSSDVVIPAYIPRGPTEILEALASTVKFDPTAARYHYHDDPFFIPTSDFEKNSAVLSKESGKRAARLFLVSFPKGFKHDEAEPKISDFNTPIKVTDNIDVTEEMLCVFVRTCQVHNAFEVYQKLKKENVHIQHDTVSELLELLCYYNSTDPVSDTYGNEKYYNVHGTVPNTWKTSGPAEKVFNELEVKVGRNYRALIQGMSKYSQELSAYKLYTEMIKKGFRGSTKMYTALIKCVPFMQKASAERWDIAKSFLRAMADDGLEPDVQTFNSLLKLLTSNARWSKVNNKIMNVLAEMKLLGIEPSLVTYNYILELSYPKEIVGPKSTILYDIMEVVEGKVFELAEPSDFTFFKSAMRVCNKHLRDLDLAYKVHGTLCLGDNQKTLTNYVDENTYYTNFLGLLCSFESLDNLFSIYDQLVPNKVTPNRSSMKAILTIIENSEEVEYLPKIWSDICLFGITAKDGILEQVLSIVGKTIDKQSRDIQYKLMAVVWNIWELPQDENKDIRMQITFTESMLGDMLTACVAVKDLEKAWKIASFLFQGKVALGLAPVSSLLGFCRFALDSRKVQMVLPCYDYALERDIPELVDFFHKHEHKLPRTFKSNKWSAEMDTN